MRTANGAASVLVKDPSSSPVQGNTANGCPFCVCVLACERSSLVACAPTTPSSVRPATCAPATVLAVAPLLAPSVFAVALLPIKGEAGERVSFHDAKVQKEK